MSEKDAYADKVQARLDQWDAEIDRLKAKAAEAEADARLEYAEEIEELRARQRRAREQLEALREAGEAAWGDLKAGMDDARDRLEEAMKRARARFD